MRPGAHTCTHTDTHHIHTGRSMQTLILWTADLHEIAFSKRKWLTTPLRRGSIEVISRLIDETRRRKSVRKRPMVFQEGTPPSPLPGFSTLSLPLNTPSSSLAIINLLIHPNTTKGFFFFKKMVFNGMTSLFRIL